MQELAEKLKAYREWLLHNATPLAQQLRKGLAARDIVAAIGQYASRSEGGFAFPDDHYALFEIFNGQRNTKAWLLPNEQERHAGLSLASLDLMASWRSNAQGMVYALKGLSGYGSVKIDPRIEHDFWNGNWFPFASGEYLHNGEGIGLLLFLDFAPTASGSRGQVVFEEMQSINFKLHLSRTVVAPSLLDYFSNLLLNLQTGTVIYDPKVGLRVVTEGACKSPVARDSVSNLPSQQHSLRENAQESVPATGTADLIQRWKEITNAVSSVVDWYVVERPVPRYEIEATEQRLGRALPVLLRELLALSGSWQWRDSEYDVIFSRPEEILQDAFPPSGALPAIEVAVSNSAKVKPYFYSPQRLTFAYSDYLRFQIDDDPGVGGTPGQVVVVDHDEQTIDLVADSLEAFVSHGLDQLHRVIYTGRYPDDFN